MEFWELLAICFLITFAVVNVFAWFALSAALQRYGRRKTSDD